MSRIGVLLTNLGSPAAPTAAAVRRYLSEFLGDPLVVDANPIVWWLVRNLIVLPFRSRSSAALYRSIWTEEGSPLIAISRRQADAVAVQLGDAYHVELAMRYGQPSIQSGLLALREQECTEILVLPMFPQASRTTTGTLEREARRAWKAIGGKEPLAFVEPYYAHEAYVGSQASRIRRELDPDGEVDHVILSFHGLPVRLVEDLGDPYRDHCEASARAIARDLGLAEGSWTLAYQSRFGREPWLGPDVVQVARELALERRRVLIACPGFTADCLETLEEIQVRLRETFHGEGGEELCVVPCVNDDPEWIDGLARIVREATG